MRILSITLVFFLFFQISNAQYTSIPDINFELKLIALGLDSGDPDNMVLTANIENETHLNVKESNISDLTGIEGFINLQDLNCSDNLITTLDLSANVDLIELRCHRNNLGSLDVSGNTALKILLCFDNQLSLLNVSTNTQLTHLYCWENQLTALDVSFNTLLEHLRCRDNLLESIDVSTNIELIRLQCHNNQLNNLNVKNDNNPNISTFNATNNPELNCIQVDDREWSQNNWLDVDPGVDFSIDCSFTGYTPIPDLNFEQRLIDLGVDTEGILDGQILTLDAVNQFSLDVSDASISNLSGIEAFVYLQSLNCHRNQLSSLDLSSNTTLLELGCRDNQLISLNVSSNPALTSIDCGENQLSNLDVQSNTQLVHLDCGSNQLTSLDLSNNTALLYFAAGHNFLTSLDLSHNTNIIEVWCGENQLSSLDLRNGNNTFISVLYAVNNPSLICILVDEDDLAFWESANWPEIDPWASFSDNCVFTEYISIPDPNFEQKLIDLGLDPWGTLDGQILKAYAIAQVSLNVADANISDLTGIEEFVNLEYLYCQKNNLTTLNVAANTKLIRLYCFENQLDDLDVGANTDLNRLYCWNNNLSVLDVSNNALLSIFACDYNQLTSLLLPASDQLWFLDISHNQLNNVDVSSLPGLQRFYFTDNQLNSIDLSQNLLLSRLYCSNNLLSSLDVSAKPNLTELFCHDNQLTSLDVSNTPSLEKLHCQFNNLSSLDMSNKPALRELFCSFNQIQSFDLSSSTTLEILECQENQIDNLQLPPSLVLNAVWCWDNQLTHLDVSANPGLQYLDCSFNPLLDLDVSSNPELLTLYCQYTDLPGLNLSSSTKLEELHCRENQLTELFLPASQNLTFIDCFNNQLSSLNVSQNPNLVHLDCWQNQITELDVTNNAFLEYLDCDTNLLTELDVSSNPELHSLYCGRMELDYLDVSANHKLQKLGCYQNNLTSLDVTNNPQLDGLYIADNQIESINLNNNPLLAEIWFSRNLFTSLDFSDKPLLTQFWCTGNPLTYLDLRNGGNTQIPGDEFFVYSSPDLRCILVDDPSWSAANWISIDPWASFAENGSDNSIGGCNNCSMINAYTLFGFEEVHLHGDINVLNGGVGLSGTKELKLHENVIVNNPGTFARAVEVDITGTSEVSNLVIEEPIINLPDFLNNPYSEGPEIKVGEGETLVLSEEVYGKVEVEEGGIAIFTQKDIYITKELKVKKEATVKFMGCSFVRVRKKMIIEDFASLNPDNYLVNFYNEDQVEIKKGSIINANIYALDDEIVAKGKDDAITVMNGKFFAKKIKAEDRVDWSLNANCDETCLPEIPVQQMISNSDVLNNISLNHFDNLGLTISPNPFSEFIQIEFSATENVEVLVEIFDLSGMLVDKIFEGPIPANSRYIQKYYPNSLFPGVHIIRLISENGNMLQRRIIYFQ